MKLFWFVHSIQCIESLVWLDSRGRKIVHSDAGVATHAANRPSSAPPPRCDRAISSLWHSMPRSCVPKPKSSTLFNSACQNRVSPIQLLEIMRDFDESQSFVTNGIFGVKILLWRCEWLIEFVQHTTGHIYVQRKQATTKCFSRYSHIEKDSRFSWFNDVVDWSKVDMTRSLKHWFNAVSSVQNVRNQLSFVETSPFVETGHWPVETSLINCEDHLCWLKQLTESVCDWYDPSFCELQPSAVIQQNWMFQNATESI